MQRKLLVFIGSLSLVLASCGGGEEGANTTSSTTAIPAATTLEYQIVSGENLTFEVTIDQTIAISTEGSDQAAGGAELPGTAEVNVTGTGLLTYEFADGPEPDTFQVTVSGSFDDVIMSGTVDGEPIDPEDTPEFAQLEPIDASFVVDSKGNIISGDTGLDDAMEMLGGLDALSGLANAGSSNAALFGPALADEPVGVGDSWDSEVVTQGFDGEEIVSRVSSVLSGTDESAGHEVLVIESSALTDGYEIDLGDFLVGLLASFITESIPADEKAELELMMDQLRFLVVVDESTAASRTLFDPAVGLNRVLDVDSEVGLTMDISIPDETSDELVQLKMTMTIVQNMVSELVRPAGA